MSDKAKPEFSLDQFSEAETDEEFGLPEFKEHFADTLTPAVLRDWTAKDFASIYVRFRPHLERHARRFLVNPSQVEEVVQDAFLYLMTSLPELDSELGVLKFLKWKVRLLAIDVIRSNSKVLTTSIQLQDVELIGLEDVSEDIERAEDAAVVSMALAKLTPRHREALIAAVYEERPSSEIASAFGMSENAFRQLLLRAKRSFRAAMIGEAEVSGMGISEILSVAARRAARSSKAAGVVTAVVLAVAVVISPSGFGKPLYTDPNFSAGINTPGKTNLAVPDRTQPAPSVAEVPQPQEPTWAELARTPNLPASLEEERFEEQPPPGLDTEPEGSRAEALAADNAEQDANLVAALLEKSLEDQTEENFSKVGLESSANLFRLTVGQGLEISLALDLEAENALRYIYFQFEAEGHIITAVPQRTMAIVSRSSDGKVYLASIGATDLLAGDLSGSLSNLSVDLTETLRYGFTIELELSESGAVVSRHHFSAKKMEST